MHEQTATRLICCAESPGESLSKQLVQLKERFNGFHSVEWSHTGPWGFLHTLNGYDYTYLQ